MGKILVDNSFCFCSFTPMFSSQHSTSTCASWIEAYLRPSMSGER